MNSAVALLVLACAAEGSWEAFQKLDLGKPKKTQVDLKAEAEAAKTDAVGTLQCKSKAFVINLYKRRDRCICMSHQLKNAPFKAERFNAVTFSDPREEEKRFKQVDKVDPVTGVTTKVPDYNQFKQVTSEDMQYSNLCGGLFKNGVKGGTHSVLQEMSLFCSHFNLWNKLKNEPEDAFIVMEDDLPMSNKIWGKIDNFFKHYTGKWDFVQVDAYGKNGTEMPLQDKVDEFEGSPIYKPSENGDYWGGHMFLLRKKAVHKMLARMRQDRSEPVDWLPRKWAQNSDIEVRTVQFGLINYIDEAKRNEYYKEANCGPNVDMSDINFSGKRATGNKMGGQRGQKAKNEGGLECPAQAQKTTLKKK